MRSRAELERDWTIDEVAVMHDILDALDEADMRARAHAEEEARDRARSR